MATFVFFSNSGGDSPKDTITSLNMNFKNSYICVIFKGHMLWLWNGSTHVDGKQSNE